ncbi:MAG: MarR family transcriptional regulator [Acidobacteriaceae bacterium]
MKKTAESKLSRDTIPLLVADVFQLAGAFRRWGDSIAAEVGQTQARWQVLSAASVGDRTVAQLARRLGLSRQGVQRAADLLVADGLAQYAENPHNERSPHLRLTKTGTQSLATLTAAASAYHQQLAEGLSMKELETALVVLRKLRMQLERDASEAE